uniref:Uncharacterized protein n=1 Tax=Setaria digitata TaxID=48799 RepID=A0A915PVX7_9BILA
MDKTGARNEYFGLKEAGDSSENLPKADNTTPTFSKTATSHDVQHQPQAYFNATECWR